MTAPTVRLILLATAVLTCAGEIEGQTKRISEGRDPSFSADARLVAFVAGNNVAVYDVRRDASTPVSTGKFGVPGNQASREPAISGDGRFVAFVSQATNLVAKDGNNEADVFVHELHTKQTTRISVSSTGAEANGTSSDPSISSDGRYVAFVSQATNLVSGDSNGVSDVFVHDRQTGRTTRASVTNTGEEGNGQSVEATISADGRYVTFTSQAGLAAGDSNAVADVFLRDLHTGQTTRVSVNSLGQEGNGESRSPSVSGDGRYVAFQSLATNLVNGDANGTRDVFVRDRQANRTTRVGEESEAPSISADGRFVAFTGGIKGVLVHDRQLGDTNQAGAGQRAIISADGRLVACERNSTVYLAAVPRIEVNVSREVNQFEASVIRTTNQAVTWSIHPPVGRISPYGLYSWVPATPLLVSVNAHSAEDPARAGADFIPAGGGFGELYSADTFVNPFLHGWTIIDQHSTEASSNWSVVDGVVTQTSDIGGGSTDGFAPDKPGTYLLKSGGWTNYTFSCRLRSTDDDAIGIMFGYRDGDNYYRFSMDRERRYRRLEKVVDGVFTVLAQDSIPYEQGRWYNVQAAMARGIIQLLIDGQVLFNVRDMSHAGGAIALYAWKNNGAHFDDIAVIQRTTLGCTYTFHPTSVSVGFGEATGSVGVSTQQDCLTEAFSTASWLTFVGPGEDPTTLRFAIAQNSGVVPRDAKLVLEDAAFTVRQAGAPGAAGPESSGDNPLREDAGIFKGVRNVWVSSSQWPNARTHKTFADDAVRLYGAMQGTEEQRAKAIHYYAMRVMGHGGDYFQGPYGGERAVWDSWMIFHNYPKALCEWWGWFMIDLWKAYKNNWAFSPGTAVARKVGIDARFENPTYLTHVQTALGYMDTDGISRWHLFDGGLGFFLYPAAIHRVATPDEIKAGFPDLLLLHENQPDPFFVGATVHGDPESNPYFHRLLGDTYPWAYSGSMRKTKFSTDFDLRIGESLRRQWYDDGKWVIRAADKNKGVDIVTDSATYYRYSTGEAKDPYNFAAIWPYIKSYPGLGLRKPFGNAYSVYTASLGNDEFKQGANSFSGVASKTGDVKLGAAQPGVEGSVVYQSRSIYPFAESSIAGTYCVKSPGRVAVDFSLDRGGTWTNILSDTSVRPVCVPFNINIGKPRWLQGLPSPYNIADRYHMEGGNPQYNDYSYPGEWDKVVFTGYQYLVRIRILAQSDTSRVGLGSLILSNTHQTNIGMLPALLPGHNTVTLDGGEISAGAVLKIEYAWSENGFIHSRTEQTVSLPFTFDITVDEPNALNVRSLYYTVWAATAGGGPGTPTNPSPVHRAINVPAGPTLSWVQGTGATSHDVYFGPTEQPPFVRNVTGSSYTPGTLGAGTWYYWRVVAKAGSASTSSPVWAFKTGTAAPSNPSPANGATGVTRGPTLRWTAGTGAASHEVHFGVTTAPPRIATVTGTSYALSGLQAARRYYWQIVAKTSGGVYTPSPVWSFTTQ